MTNKLSRTIESYNYRLKLTKAREEVDAMEKEMELANKKALDENLCPSCSLPLDMHIDFRYGDDYSIYKKCPSCRRMYNEEGKEVYETFR